MESAIEMEFFEEPSVKTDEEKKSTKFIFRFSLNKIWPFY